MPQANPPSETHSAALARKLARIEWLRADNLADRRPSFTALLSAGREAACAMTRITGRMA